jgi:5-(carboxyamino)imidazole ribonucleotide mutase
MKSQQALVGIVMGSDSDLPAMKPAADVLDSMGIAWEMAVVSAHRTPDRMYEYAKGARKRGIKVIIAGAGGAAHLPGMVASMTGLPVIGVPVRTKTLDGLDSLLSIVQMPGGVPVATVAIDNGKNAGLLAARILGAFDPRVADELERYRSGLEAEVLAKSALLERDGPTGYKAPEARTPADWAGLSGSGFAPKA